MIRLYGFLLALAVTGLTACEGAGRITDILPDAVFLEHNPQSEFPNINSVPEEPDPRLIELGQPDQVDSTWVEGVANNQQELQEKESPVKRIYNDPEWPIDEN